MVKKKKQYESRILLVPFTTYYDYKNDLELICKEVSVVGKRLCVYLAAAVSDFYINAEELVSFRRLSYILQSLSLARAQDPIRRWRVEPETHHDSESPKENRQRRCS